MKTKYIVWGVILLIVIWSWSSYNGLVRSNLAADTQWAQVEAQYQRRFDLIPNLVASVEGNMKQESAVFLAIANARANYAGAKTVNDKVVATNNVESALGRLLVITENYPDLKSSVAVQGLMAELAGTENRVSVERGRYNDTVNVYNVKVQTFPGNLFAKSFGFSKRDFFTADEGAQKAPQVNFNK